MAVNEEHVIDSIYAAALNPDLWRDVLEALGDVAGSESTAISQLNVLTGTGKAVVINNNNRTLKDYFGYYYQINPLQIVENGASYAQGWLPVILRDEDWVDRATLEASEYYNDFLRPIHAQWGMILRLGLSGHDVTAISIGRSRGRFEDDEIAAAARFHPHLIRAVGLSNQFADIHRRSHGLAAAIDRARSAMLLVGADRQLLYANAAAERLIAAGTALCVNDGKVTAAEPIGALALAAAVHNACHEDRQRRIAGSFSIRVPWRGLPITGAVLPLEKEESGLFARRSATLISLPDWSDEPATSLRVRFDLTPAEERLATDLVSGLSLRSSADGRGISINTVRAQLASIFSKTGTHRQHDLIQLLSVTDIGELIA